MQVLLPAARAGDGAVEVACDGGKAAARVQRGHRRKRKRGRGAITRRRELRCGAGISGGSSVDGGHVGAEGAAKIAAGTGADARAVAIDCGEALPAPDAPRVEETLRPMPNDMRSEIEAAAAAIAARRCRQVEAGV